MDPHESLPVKSEVLQTSNCEKKLFYREKLKVQTFGLNRNTVDAGPPEQKHKIEADSPRIHFITHMTQTHMHL